MTQITDGSGSSDYNNKNNDQRRVDLNCDCYTVGNYSVVDFSRPFDRLCVVFVWLARAIFLGTARLPFLYPQHRILLTARICFLLVNRVCVCMYLCA